jgi:hypothetical protein
MPKQSSPTSHSPVALFELCTAFSTRKDRNKDGKRKRKKARKKARKNKAQEGEKERRPGENIEIGARNKEKK